MDEEGMGALEQAIADVGSLLVEAQKYAVAAAEAETIGVLARALGADARRLLRRDALDNEQTTHLQAIAAGLLDRLRAAIREARDQPGYRTAVGCYAQPDDAQLAALIPQIFATVGLAGAVPALFAPVAWTRRGRARTTLELVEAVAALAHDGMSAEGDDLTAGADATLRAVMFDSEPPEDEALVLQIDPARLEAPLFQHAETGTFLVYRPQLRVPFTVHVAERVDLDVTPPDYPDYRRSLVNALRAAGLDVAPDEEPST